MPVKVIVTPAHAMPTMPASAAATGQTEITCPLFVIMRRMRAAMTAMPMLFAMLMEHLERVVRSVEEAIAMQAPPRDKLLAMVQVYTQKSAQSRRRHMIAMQDVKYLPRAKQTPLIELQRKLTDLVARLLHEVNPGLPNDVYKPYTMMLIGLLNWTDMWYRPNGTMKPQELCDRISRLFLKGFMAEKA